MWLFFLFSTSGDQIGFQNYQASIAVSVHYQDVSQSEQPPSISPPANNITPPRKDKKPSNNTPRPKISKQTTTPQKATKPTPLKPPAKTISSSVHQKITKKLTKEVVTTTNTQSKSPVTVKKTVQRAEASEKTMSKKQIPPQELDQPKSEPENTMTTPSQQPRYELGSPANPKPKAPAFAKKMGWEGDVIIGVYLAADGAIEHMEFVKSTHYSVLNYEAWETVRNQWTFKPLETSNSGQSGYVEVPISFNH